ncbi:ExeM/NucH family extracellular endonuclease [Aeromicrobium sp. NPDC092404]|uniref:ExeM/NucH family extracellular endonuclease n=1 Tax=Aeromicrobium sp. NPDC092404 TaxID=3154976 RepID=UPI003438CE08
MHSSTIARWASALAVGAATLVAVPASASVAGDGIVINELYVNGGSANAPYNAKFVELYNPTDEAVDLSTWSLQYRPPTNSADFPAATKYDLEGIIQPGKTFLVGGSGNGQTGAALPTPDQVTTFSPGNGGGSLALVSSTDLLPAAVVGDVKGSLSSANGVVDFIGWGNANTYETAAAAAPTATSDPRSLNRSAYADSDNNSADFTRSTTVSPLACGPTCALPTPTPYDGPIAGIQGTDAVSPVRRAVATTRGVVTAVYRTGGFSGAYIQTPGTGGAIDLDQHDASDGLFVFGSSFANGVDKGDYVEVVGKVVEFGGMTELNATSFSKLPDEHEAVVPAQVTFPLSAAEKESLEGMLLAPQGQFTITNNYTTNQYAEIGLAPGDEPFDTPTNVVAPGAPAKALAAKNAADLVTLDDGSSLNFLSAANQSVALPWLTPTNEVRVGQHVAFDDPVVLDHRNNAWRLQPTQQLLAGGDEPVVFGPSTRAAAPKDVGGAVKVGTFNVLNYFTTTAEAYDAGAGNVCTYYTDRAGNKITANECGNPSAGTGNGPRGAANAVNLGRQQAKIVKAINALDADVVSLEEIENSLKFGIDRDTALSSLVDALNADAGETRWAFVESPAQLPDLAGQDLIRTAFIYQPDVVDVVGESRILDVPAFDNAREPLAQAFKLADGSADSTFAVIVNHFKSKGSGSGVDADTGDGQGASNPARVAQANALVDFAEEFGTAAGTDKVFLTGDFNSYNEEDPVKVIEDAGYVNVPAELTDKETYQFDGAVGSLDHVFASPEAFANVTGADIWNINSYESLAREYSRHNYNVTDFYQVNPYRASDHDPEIVGFDPGPVATTVTADAPHSVRAGADIEVAVAVTSSNETPATGAVTVSEGGTELDEAALEDGRATLDAGALGLGTHVLKIAYAGDRNHQPSTTTVTVTVLRSDADISATVDPSTYGTSAVVTVTGGPQASGLVFVGNGDTVIGSGMMTGGSATISLDTSLPPGDYELDVYYAGDQSYEPAQTTADLTVGKAATTTKRIGTIARVVKGKTWAKVPFVVSSTAYTPSGGTVKVYQGTKLLGTGTVSNGKVTVSLARFATAGRKTLVAKYSGDAFGGTSSVTFTLVVASK